MAILAASILDADLGRLREEVELVDRAGIDMVSLDVVDGRFAPRISFGDALVSQVRTWTLLPLEVHLMIDEPDDKVVRYMDAGADLVVFHIEAAKDAGAIIAQVKERDLSVGIAILSSTPVDEVIPWLPYVDVVNFLAVPVGFGGNASAPDTLERIGWLRARAQGLHPELLIEVDGGVKPSTAFRYVAAGADMLTVGTGIYHAPDTSEAVRELRVNAGDVRPRERGAGFMASQGQRL